MRTAGFGEPAKKVLLFIQSYNYATGNQLTSIGLGEENRRRSLEDLALDHVSSQKAKYGLSGNPIAA